MGVIVTVKKNYISYGCERASPFSTPPGFQMENRFKK